MLCNAYNLISCEIMLCKTLHLCGLFFFFNLSCMDASIAVKPVFDRFQSVVITSGVSYLVAVNTVLQGKFVSAVVMNSKQTKFSYNHQAC